jgi:hypothetical protein
MRRGEAPKATALKSISENFVRAESDDLLDYVLPVLAPGEACEPLLAVSPPISSNSCIGS